MRRKYIITLLAFFYLTVPGLAAAASEDGAPVCTRLEEKAGGATLKYSLDGDANGPVYFNGISCAIEFRNRELCAMEMISFDTTAKVYDFYNTVEIEVAKAYFWLDENNQDAPILAFSTKEDAEDYHIQKKGGLILDYPGLTDKLLK